MANENVAVARGYHERTKHSEERLRAGPHDLDWENQPVPFKLYRDLETIPLPRQREPGTVSALRAISALVGRETEPCEQVPGLQELARVLYYSAGITKVKRSPGGDVYFRAAANTGALYHVDLYLICRDLPDLAAGIYHFGPHDFALRCLRVGDYRGALIEAAGVEPLAQAPVVVASASTYWRNAWKYRERAYRHAFWDGGTLHTNLLAVAAARGLAAKVVAGFADRDVEHLLGLDPAREGALALVPLGRTAEPPPPVPDAPVLKLETEPLSSREIEYPAIRAIHSASSLEHGEEVARWGRVVLLRPEPDPLSDVFPLRPLAEADWPTEPLESVILRRGSTRRFDVSRSLTFEELSTALSVATASIPADFTEDLESSLLDLYVIAHAVEGLPPGA
ncbi:MAG: SagB/ThcOx family dehydrogenase, partial [Gaiellaceae bacterium]